METQCCCLAIAVDRNHLLIIAGFWLLASAWKVLYEAQRNHRLATTGAYARVRHPQYAGFILIMTGFLFQWPTLVTLSMFPMLVFMYVLLARQLAPAILLCATAHLHAIHIKHTLLAGVSACLLSPS